MRIGILAIALTLASNSALSAFIDRSSFGPAAINVDFSDGIDNAPIYASGNLSVSGGNVTTNEYGNIPDPMDGFSYTNDGGGGNPAGAPIRLDFSSSVSAVGVDIYYNEDPVLFEFFDSTDTLIESIFATPTDFHDIGGYFGFNAESDEISYALFSMPTKPTDHNLFIDNVIYQSVVPIPAALPLFGSALGLMGFIGWRKRKQV